MDLSFAGCQCPQAIKTKKAWQKKLLNNKTICIVEAIPLAAGIFWDHNFALYPRYTFNLTRKLGLKIKELKAKVENERIRYIWANKTIPELNLFFMNNPE